MSEADCTRFMRWALPKLGLRWPGFRKVRTQVCKRLQRRLRELGLADPANYRAYLLTHASEWEVLDSLCHITISRFYRDRGVFDHLSGLPDLAERVLKRKEEGLRCWSAGCASGEEAYTLSLIWVLRLRARSPDVGVHVVATDADVYLLEHAKRGCYPVSSLRDLPVGWLEHFSQSNGDFREA